MQGQPPPSSNEHTVPSDSGDMSQNKDVPSEAPPPLPTGSDLYFNRELSWLEFNQRVLDEAASEEVPLLERLKFLGITAANLDEFFMVRVAGLIEQHREGAMVVPADGMTPVQQLEAIASRTHTMIDAMADTFRDLLLPSFEAEGVCIAKPSMLSPAERERLRSYFHARVLPILTPLAIDPGHPFPHVRNKSLHLIVLLGGGGGPPAFAVVQVPGVIPRLVPVEGEGPIATFVLLEDVIAEHVGDLFRGFRQVSAWPFRVIRNFDFSVDEEEAEDLLEVIEEEVRRRDRGNAVRLTVDARTEPEALAMLREALNVDDQFVYRVDGPLDVTALSGLSKPLAERRDLKDAPFVPAANPDIAEADTIFEVIDRGDVLLHHPYESFDPVVRFLQEAAVDPEVLAIKQTLYRTSGDSPIVQALVRAAEMGKQVAALIEIKARFDEENNIVWARKLEESGVHVVYGLVGLKTHSKITLVVRRDGNKLKRYIHLGTGNYNPSTAKLYTDVSLFTCAPELGEDATALFNLLTSCTPPRDWRRLIVAPLGLHERVLGLIEREAAYARAGRAARVIAKMNALVDKDVIDALYRASQAGVQVDLIVRGICCLRPGIEGLSENIRVRSVVDRFLEHSRIYFFESGGRRELYASSADWMPRNFQRRVELMFPIDAEGPKARVLDEILALSLEDDTKASVLEADGRYTRLIPRDPKAPARSQLKLLAAARRATEQAAARARRERPFIVRPIRNLPNKMSATPIETPPDEDGGE